MQPLISIIVPVYNVENYLAYCIERILHQTYQHLEILLLDDGSTDSSLQLCREFESKDSRCTVFHHENHGVAYTRNRGIQLAKGEYISFIDSDDYVDETFIETLYTHIIQDDYDFAMVDVQPTFNHDLKDVSHSNQSLVLSQRQFFHYLYNRIPKAFNYLHDTIFILVTNKLYTRHILTGISFPPYALSEDLYFNNKVFLRARKCIFIREKLFYYFQRTDSASHVINRKYIQKLEAYFESLKHIPAEEEEYRAACLIKLYKIILNTRFHIRELSDKDELESTIENTKNKTITEMSRSRFIPFYMKSFLIFCYEFPFLYKWFMYLCELRAKV